MATKTKTTKAKTTKSRSAKKTTTKKATTKKATTKKPAKERSQLEAAVQVLTRSKKPMSCKELVDAMTPGCAAGIRVARRRATSLQATMVAFNRNGRDPFTMTST